MKKYWIYFLIASASFIGYSQKIGLNKGEKQYEKYAYIDAISTYERIAEKGYKDAEMFKRLGNSYYFNADYTKAVKWYSELINMNQSIEPEYYFRYSVSLKSINDFKNADLMMQKFNELNQKDLRAEISNSQKDYLEIINKNSNRYNIESAGINSEYVDYGTTLFGDKVIFTTTRDTMGLFKRKNAWNNQSFSNLYSATITENGNLSKPERFAKELNSAYDESTPIFTKDGKFMYFTRSNFLKKKGKDSEGTTKLKIYRAEFIEGKWTNIYELPFNSDSYNVAHPTFSTDEKYLFFASDMPGTFGASDIFKVEIKENHTNYGTPVNLGKIINTEGKDTFPFIDEKGNLYYATDGRPGLGGLDIFKSIVKNNDFTEPLNVGKPVNGNFDDFAFFMIPGTKTGFFSSNRKEDNQGYDDIYKFTEIEELEKCEQVLIGTVIDEQTKKPIPFAKLSLFDDKFVKITEITANEKGEYDFGTVTCELKYYVRAEKEDYETREVSVTIANKSGKTEVPIELTPRVKKFALGDDINKAFNKAKDDGKEFALTIIYFDLDKSNIRKDAAFDLEKILDVLKQNPSMHIDVRSHTDCRQTKEYNRKLSDRRAKATVAWLVKNGIDKSRLTGKGYGESQLVNDCACEPTNQSNCSEEEHQLNRRSEFIITKL